MSKYGKVLDGKIIMEKSIDDNDMIIIPKLLAHNYKLIEEIVPEHDTKTHYKTSEYTVNELDDKIEKTIVLEERKPSQFHIKVGDSFELDINKKEDLILDLINKINKNTDSVIENDFVHGEINFSGDAENQRNFMSLYHDKDNVNTVYPYQVKGRDNKFLQINSAEEMNNLYWSAKAHIMTAIEAGWAEKQTLLDKTMEELYTKYLSFETVNEVI